MFGVCTAWFLYFVLILPVIILAAIFFMQVVLFLDYFGIKPDLNFVFMLLQEASSMQIYQSSFFCIIKSCS